MTVLYSTAAFSFSIFKNLISKTTKNFRSRKAGSITAYFIITITAIMEETPRAAVQEGIMAYQQHPTPQTSFTKMPRMV